MKMIKLSALALLGTALALSMMTAAQATMMPDGLMTDNTFIVDGVYSAGGLAIAGGISDGYGIEEQTSYSGTGTINESDLVVTLDVNGLHSLDYTGHSGGYAVQENSITAQGGSYSVSGSYVTGGVNLDLSVSSGELHHPMQH